MAQDTQAVQPTVSGLSLEELVALRSEVDSLIEQKQMEFRKILYDQMHSLAQSAGFESVDAFIASQQSRQPRSDKGIKMPAKYKNPQNVNQTWSGQGRKPNWVLAHLDAGGQLEELKIG